MKIDMGIYESICDECGNDFMFISVTNSYYGKHKNSCSKVSE